MDMNAYLGCPACPKASTIEGLAAVVGVYPERASVRVGDYFQKRYANEDPVITPWYPTTWGGNPTPLARWMATELRPIMARVLIPPHPLPPETNQLTGS